MGGCRCSYKNCPSATKTTDNIHFFHYPVKQAERCRKWIENAGKPAFFDLAEDQLRNKVVCELHFESKCFTNIEKKRLLHDAVPTLDAGCEAETSSEVYQIKNFEDVTILPANADGTIFTVDTDSMHQAVEPEKVESYIYKDGMLVPLKNSGRSKDNTFYGLEETKVKHNPDEMFYETIETDEVSSGNEIILNRMQFLGNGSQLESFNTTVQFIPVKDESMESNLNGSSSLDSRVGSELRASKQLKAQKKFVKQIKQHSREIASIKKVLRANRPLVYSRTSKKAALQVLRSILPSSLYSLLCLNVQESDLKSLSQKDLGFYKEVYKTSSSVYNILKDKYGWALPDPSDLQTSNKNEEISTLQ